MGDEVLTKRRKYGKCRLRKEQKQNTAEAVLCFCFLYFCYNKLSYWRLENNILRISTVFPLMI